MATRYLRIKKFATETGWSERAVETKIFRGVWIEGRHYRRAPDNSILIDMEGYNKWVENQPAEAYGQPGNASKSGLSGKANR